MRACDCVRGSEREGARESEREHGRVYVYLCVWRVHAVNVRVCVYVCV